MWLQKPDGCEDEKLHQDDAENEDSNHVRGQSDAEEED